MPLRSLSPTVRTDRGQLNDEDDRMLAQAVRLNPVESQRSAF